MIRSVAWFLGAVCVVLAAQPISTATTAESRLSETILAELDDVLSRMEPGARAVLTDRIQRAPRGARLAIDAAIRKGWRPTEYVLHAGRPQSSRGLGNRLISQDHAAGSIGEVVAWTWDDGVWWTVEGMQWKAEWTYGQQAWEDFQVVILSDDDLYVDSGTVHDYYTGSVYAPDGEPGGWYINRKLGPQVPSPRLRNAALGPTPFCGLSTAATSGGGASPPIPQCILARLQCLRDSYSMAFRKALRDTRYQFGGAFVGCAAGSGGRFAPWVACFTFGYVAGYADNVSNILREETFCGGCGPP